MINELDERMMMKKGDRFVTTEETPAHCLTVWGAPYTGGFRCVIPKGTVLVVAHEPVTGASGFTVVPEEYERMEEMLVPEEDRKSREYGGYYFVFNHDEVGLKLVKLPDRVAETNLFKRAINRKELLQVAVGLAAFILLIVVGEKLNIPTKYTFLSVAIGVFIIGRVFFHKRR